MNKDRDRRNAVRETYARIARKGGSCCAPDTSGQLYPGDAGEAAQRLGYGPEQLDALPRGANLGLGCGNPVERAELRPGEIVVDLGSGPGLDALLAARLVGPRGFVLGLDMTPEMIERARANAAEAGITNVTFHLGELTRLPLEDGLADAILSNCVVNLCPDKAAAFAEMLRVLRPGGRLCLADILRDKPLPQALRDDPAAWCA